LAGENIAGRCRECGASIAVVEAELVGGECSYWACMPRRGPWVPGASTAVTGPGVGELLRDVAIAGEVPLDTLRHVVPSCPTIGEVWLRLLEAYGL
jgi:hypothetical protein